MIRIQSTFAGFEDGGGAMSQGIQPLEAGNGKETDSALEPPEEKAALPTPRF